MASDAPSANAYSRTTSSGFFISAQSQEDGLPKLVVAGPLGELDLSDQHWFNPRTVALLSAPRQKASSRGVTARRSKQNLRSSLNSKLLRSFFFAVCASTLNNGNGCI
jgi:hypothetical protein